MEQTPRTPEPLSDDPEADFDAEGCLDCGEPWEMCECRAGEECGRWRNGRLTSQCMKAGSEECDFECPYNR